MKLKEEWRNVVGFGKDNYEVSNYGEVRTIARRVSIGRGKTRRVQQYKKLQFGRDSNPNGHLKVILSVNGKTSSVRIAKLVLMAFTNYNGKDWIRHTDGDVKNNKLNNLYWIPQGSTKSSPKNIHLTRDEVIEIRRRSNLGESNKMIALSLNRNTHQVRQVVRGVTFKEVT